MSDIYVFAVDDHFFDDSIELFSFIRGPAAFAELILRPDCEFLFQVHNHEVRMPSFLYLSSLKPVALCNKTAYAPRLL